MTEKESKTRTLQKAAVRIEFLLADYTVRLPKKYRTQLEQSHQEIKQVRDRLAHERLMSRRTLLRTVVPSQPQY